MEQRGTKQAAEFSQDLKRWVADWERKHNRYRVPLKELAEGIGVSFPTFSRWWNGIHAPDGDSSFSIARFLEVPPEDVLKSAGHAVTTPFSFPSLLKTVETSGELWSDKEFIISYLRLTQSPDWQSSKSHWKQEAVDVLLSGAELHDKASKVARCVYTWTIDSARESTLEHKPLANGK